MKILASILRFVDQLTRLAGIAAAWAFFLAGLFVAYEVVMRKLGMPTKWTEEFSQIAQIWGVYLGAAFVLQSRGLITVDIIGDGQPVPAERRGQF